MTCICSNDMQICPVTLLTSSGWFSQTEAHYKTSTVILFFKCWLRFENSADPTLLTRARERQGPRTGEGKKFALVIVLFTCNGSAPAFIGMC